MDELAADLVTQHPEFLQLINTLVAKRKDEFLKATNPILRMGIGE